MSNKITIDKEQLELNIAKLEKLVSDSSLSDKASAIQKQLTKSQGASKKEVDTITKSIKCIEEQLNLLFTNTLDFFKNAKTSFVEVDEGLAEQLKASQTE